MHHAAYLIGISQYPDHTLAGVPNDLTLMERALRHQNFADAAIHRFADEQATQDGLFRILARIRTDFASVRRGLCFLHVSAGGMLALDPLRGGIQPLDGDEADFDTAVPFTALNDYLPVRSGVQVIAVLDT